MIRIATLYRIAPLLLASAALPAHVHAQAMKPGLWELSSKMNSSDGAMGAAMARVREQLANLSPEQRRAMQQTMEQHGMRLDVGANGDVRTRMCMTREMAERHELPVQQGDCTQKATPLSANRVKVSFSCTRPRASGEGEVTMENDRNYRAHMHIMNEEPRQTVDMDVSGKWLAADCGKVRPVAIPPAQQAQ